jgi:hypothetical protein
MIFGCPHTTGSSPVAALVCRPAQAVPEPPPDQQGHDLRLEY